ncbi:MFS transporter [Mycetocola lacteus]|uniref:MFS transporter n=1 Tax=Mycetocola lacteus TaxID=76637 RepID=A0A3L7AQN0_9MICO|nr:MFS transporter [Mycetocola lacteus]RLP82789.1 MFS transporter [Mycetocola lacteus]
MPLKTRAKGLLAAPPPAPRLSAEVIAKRYPRLRLQVFIGIFIGYAGFYLIRNNLPLVAAILEDNGQINKAGIGLVANATLISYGFSKFFSAIISDRSNARYFLPLGLALSAVANLAVAFIPAVTASLAIFATVMFINGWFQGMGWPPSGRVLVHWFSTSERGIKTSIWNVAHNVGGVGAGALVALGLQLTANDWTTAFWLPAVVALVVALAAFLLIRDTPESQGLPPIEEYRNDPAKVAADETEDSTRSAWSLIKEHVLMNRTMVLLALANVCVYALRYGILVWAPIYLTQVRGASVTGGIAGFSLFELAGIGGTILCGILSDKVFRGNRSMTGIAFMVAVAGMTAIYWLLPEGVPIWMPLVAVTLIGGLIYGPVMLIGLQALDLSPRHVAGTAAGFTGLFGYVIGATMASSGVGFLVENFGWNITFIALIAIALLTVVFLALINKDEKAALAR